MLVQKYQPLLINFLNVTAVFFFSFPSISSDEDSNAAIASSSIAIACSMTFLSKSTLTENCVLSRTSISWSVGSSFETSHTKKMLNYLQKIWKCWNKIIHIDTSLALDKNILAWFIHPMSMLQCITLFCVLLFLILISHMWTMNMALKLELHPTVKMCNWLFVANNRLIINYSYLIIMTGTMGCCFEERDVLASWCVLLCSMIRVLLKIIDCRKNWKNNRIIWHSSIFTTTITVCLHTVIYLLVMSLQITYRSVCTYF